MCFEAGVHVLIEKPLAITMAAGRQMLESARAAQRTLGVAEVVRYMTETRATRWAIENGILGQVQMYAKGVVGGHEWAPDVIVGRTPWRLKKMHAGGGPALDLGVHWFDLIRYACGEVESVSGLTRQVEAQRFLRDDAGRVIEMSHVDVEDTFFANFTLANGAVGNLMYSWGGHGAGAGVEGGPVIWGTKGCLKGHRLIFDDGMKAEIIPYYQQHATPEVKEKWFPHGITDPFALQCLDFLSAIGRGENPEVSGEEGLKDMAAAYAILESSTAGHLVQVEDVLSGKVSAYQKEIDRHHHLGKKKKSA
jgi:predicted dehydrogenase